MPRGWRQKSHSWSLEPNACVRGSKGCSFKSLPKHMEAVKQTETQEWRKQTENQAGCCSVVKQMPLIFCRDWELVTVLSVLKDLGNKVAFDGVFYVIE